MSVKSLKSFFKQQSIIDEVKRWDINDCESYLKKHEEDKIISPIVKKRLQIVAEQYADKIIESDDETRFKSGILAKKLYDLANQKVNKYLTIRGGW